MDRQITPYMSTRDAVARTRSPLFGPERFTYQLLSRTGSELGAVTL
jgi:hypothetical protein